MNAQRGIVLAVATAILGIVSMSMYFANDMQVTTAGTAVFGSALVSAVLGIIEFQRSRYLAKKAK